MHGAAHSYRGPLLMVLSMGSYIVSDTFMKLATAGLPPYEVLSLRGIFATSWGMLLLSVLRKWRQMPVVFDRWVTARNLIELLCVLCYVLALANMPIANVVALTQITPLVVLIGASLMFGERLSVLSMVLIGIGFAGAVLVAQPGRGTLSSFALLAIGNAVFGALRDLVGRRVPGHVPGIMVAFGACILVLAGAIAMHLIFEETAVPGAHHLLLLAASGLFLFGGHYLLFMAYRLGPTANVAPFYYFFTFWALIAGILVFGTLPNLVALAGILLVIASGLAIVVLDRRQLRKALVE
ncbi:EamA family transporter [Rhizobium lusitanum]|uniref:EamA family transporter n=1 Tax=Rhizobium lusitanum TaxID=293958 RepID=A0A6L9UEZ8_9HYPH|nr:DMT family transporter [Rhizobium lusitanum]NEI74585.1 EamA family transporter [Rhizobium lusitanum]